MAQPLSISLLMKIEEIYMDNYKSKIESDVAKRLNLTTDIVYTIPINRNDDYIEILSNYPSEDINRDDKLLYTSYDIADEKILVKYNLYQKPISVIIPEQYKETAAVLGIGYE